MNFGDLIRDPVTMAKDTHKMFTAPFQSNKSGKPWFQSTARNSLEAAIGEKPADRIHQRFLHDPVPGQQTGSLTRLDALAQQQQGQSQPVQSNMTIQQTGQPVDSQQQMAQLIQLWLNGGNHA